MLRTAVAVESADKAVGIAEYAADTAVDTAVDTVADTVVGTIGYSQDGTSVALGLAVRWVASGVVASDFEAVSMPQAWARIVRLRVDLESTPVPEQAELDHRMGWSIGLDWNLGSLPESFLVQQA